MISSTSTHLSKNTIYVCSIFDFVLDYARLIPISDDFLIDMFTISQLLFLLDRRVVIRCNDREKVTCFTKRNPSNSTRQKITKQWFVCNEYIFLCQIIITCKKLHVYQIPWVHAIITLRKTQKISQPQSSFIMKLTKFQHYSYRYSVAK